MEKGRRTFLRTAGAVLTGIGGILTINMRRTSRAAGLGTGAALDVKLGMVTYELGEDWDIKTIIRNCEDTGFEAVEPRTGHKHGIELSLSKEQRAEIRKRFENSRVRLLSLGTVCEFQAAQSAIVEKNIQETRRWCELAHDLGCLGVKVRPNHFVEGVPKEKTLEQIGKALRTCGRAARDQGVEIWLEVHGVETQDPPYIRRIMEAADDTSVGICWNSNDTDVVDGSVKQYFDLLKPWLRNCHIHDLWNNVTIRPTAQRLRAGQEIRAPVNGGKPYPYRELFQLMRTVGYNRYTLAEVPRSCEPILSISETSFCHGINNLLERFVTTLRERYERYWTIQEAHLSFRSIRGRATSSRGSRAITWHLGHLCRSISEILRHACDSHAGVP
jgi:sugar phosphate isomerase/epimerase